ncbi:molybdopterin molybdotransferase MoeA [Halobacillus rhizosphaerae]|uniref:molybdopterin molybdotransferase MoeA n=1 Tax=Halobacillus rhizosphaerae TaxID=3064889 RepID=UPI00398B16F5
MNLHRRPIPVEQAIDQVMNWKQIGRIETVSIEESHGRYLAEDITATNAVPPFDKSPYDGFALRSADTKGLGKGESSEFHVIEQVGAGHRASRPLHKGEAVRIMTGAEIPQGADCVAMFEVCETFEKNNQPFMKIKRELSPRQNVIEKGSEVEKGAGLLQVGQKVNPGVQAILATFGYSTIKVYQKPKVGIFATGTELLDVEEPLVPGKIRNSNAFMAAAQIERAGAEAVYLGKLEDDFNTCFEALSSAVDEVDLLITTGGVSVGDFDLMPDLYKKLEAEVLFNKIAMRPGSVTTVAQLNGKLLFGLSGNPSACYVGFELFAYPVIQHLLGASRPFHRRTKAVLGSDFKKANPFTRFVRGFIAYEDGKLVVYPAGVDKSAVVTSLARTDTFIVLRGGTRGYEAGDQVDAIFVEGETGQEHF